MKRVGNLYKQLCDKELISWAFDKAVKGKKQKSRIKKYFDTKDDCVNAVYEMFVNRDVKFGRVYQRTIKDASCGKERVITVPSFFPDQIVHWCVIAVLKPVIKRGMYQYSCGSIDGRGGLYAKEYSEKVIRNFKPKYTGKMDISKFYPSVNIEKLKQLFSLKIKDKDMLNLIAEILEVGGKGLPIGFYTSQWFSNFYLEQLDHFIKEDLKIKYYVRYVDDMVIWGNNRRQLIKDIRFINQWLAQNDYGVTLKPKWQIWKTTESPLDFVGYRILPQYTKLRKRIFFRLIRAVNTVKKSGYCCVSLAYRISSYLGWLCHINGRGIYVNIIRPIISKKELSKIIGNKSRVFRYLT